MGWLHTQGATKKDIIQSIISDCPYHSEAKNCTVLLLKHCIKGNVLWTVGETVYEGRKSERWIGCYLLRYDKGFGYGYKDMDESMHPYYFSCPLSYLDMVPVACEEWRKGVREYHAQFQASKDVKVGQRVKLVNGCSIPEVIIMSKKPLCGSYQGKSYKVKRKFIEKVIG